MISGQDPEIVMNGGDQDLETANLVLESGGDTGADLTTVTTGIVTASHPSNVIYGEKRNGIEIKNTEMGTERVNFFAFFFAFILGENT